MSPSQSETTVTIAASLNSRLASHRPRIQRPLSFASIGRGNLALPLPRLAPAGRRLVAAIDVGVRQSNDAAGVADLPRVAVARLHDDHRMQEKPDVAAVADHAETALAPRASGKIELCRILDRQHMAPARRLLRVTRGRCEHDLAGHRPIVQKPSIGHIPGAIAAKAAQTGGALGDERGQKLLKPLASPTTPRAAAP